MDREPALCNTPEGTSEVRRAPDGNFLLLFTTCQVNPVADADDEETAHFPAKSIFIYFHHVFIFSINFSINVLDFKHFFIFSINFPLCQSERPREDGLLVEGVSAG